MSYHRTKRTRAYSFRVTEEEWQQIALAAGRNGACPTDWCRDLALEKSSVQAYQMTKYERLLYEEFGRLRYLVGHGFRLLANENLTAQEWENTRAAAEHNAAKIADTMLASNRTHNQK